MMMTKQYLQQIWEWILSNIIPVLAANPLIVLVIIIILVIVVKRGTEYVNNTYFQVTKTPYADVEEDSGRLGEYMVYKHLKKFEKRGVKFLFNVYIPKGDGETTEIDVLMICHQGIQVFESKNYSGWIFGNEFQRNWCQVFPTGDWQEHREYFYNQIMQNKTHIRYLKKLLGQQIHTYSIVVFSEKCKLKYMEVESPNVYVTKCDEVRDVVSRISNDFSHELLSKREMKEIYDQLYPYSQADRKTKKRHAKKVKRKFRWFKFRW